MTRAVVLGAGFAGLAAALRLRLAGADVTVIDALARPGGKASLGWQDFSSGPTVVTMPRLLRGLHERVALPPPLLEPARPTTRYTYPDGSTFSPGALDVDGSLEPTLAQLSRSEARDYERLLNAARTMYEDARGTFVFSSPPRAVDLARYAFTRGRRAFPHLRLAQLVASGPRLTPFWLRFATYLGANPYEAPAVLLNIAWVELGLGVWHLTGWEDERSSGGGLGRLAARLAERARHLGVTFELDTTVEHLVTSGRRVVAAHTSQGVFTGDVFVSAADAAFTRAWLNLPSLPERPGISGFAVQFRLRQAVPPAHHVLFPREYAREWREIERGDLPSDPTLYAHLDGERGFFLVNAPARPDAVKDQDAYARVLLDRLRSNLKLDVTEWLPISPRAYARVGRDGAIYGRAPHGLTGTLRPSWRVGRLANLRQVGGTVHPGGGVPLSILSGWNGAGDLLGLDFDDLGGR
ncbi:phytoene desaturase family protein [Deinococcus yavapaiensis]|uniref:Phytoene dehydrogenase-like protein n=1 Tax=Deinococcus yavapaiensis KR-236 TaxID=694435 RepID=A0A318S529_9DEIO|nr:NAD(P)/FAD-dependent oxidoreductase [Deinococcus yavapaiensis]PYE53584.1 phytoene dehydrogenase-like protein [Deinococcus yavapaiensis KR-236]